jgi:hypothetical protein
VLGIEQVEYAEITLKVNFIPALLLLFINDIFWNVGAKPQRDFNNDICLKLLLVGQAGGLRIGKTLGEPAYRAFACQSGELSSRLAARLFRRIRRTARAKALTLYSSFITLI